MTGGGGWHASRLPFTKPRSSLELASTAPWPTSVPLTSILSRIAAPNWSGPPEASWLSSKTMTIRLTTSVGRIGGNAAARKTRR